MSAGESRLAAESSDRGPGTMLHLSAEDDEWISINSPDFGVTAGRSYRLTVEGSIPEASSGSDTPP